VKDAVEWIGIANMCAKVHVLPNPGGLFQQHPLHIAKLERIYEAQAKVDEDEQKNMESKRRLEEM
jgi:hypothetical protein